MKAAIEETGRLTIENLMKIQAEKEAWIHTTNQIQINSNDFNLIQKKLNSKNSTKSNQTLLNSNDFNLIQKKVNSKKFN